MEAIKDWPLRRWLSLGAVALGFAYIALHLIYPFWVESRLPDDAPRIAFSPNDTWLKTVGANEAFRLTFTLAEGRLIEVQPKDAGADPERITRWLEQNQLDGVLLAGGGDVDPRLYGSDAEASLVNRARDNFEIALIQAATKMKLPILGICRGCQILNVAHGGTLQNLKGDAHFNLEGHSIDLAPQSRLANILQTNRLPNVGSYHNQAVEKIAPNLRPAATGPGGVVEAVEGKGNHWVVAVQWHPELAVGDPFQDMLLQAFVLEAKKRRR